MKNQINIPFFNYVSLLFSIIFHSTLIGALKPGAGEREYSYIEGIPNGPSRWGDMKPEWATCKNGIMQSPVDITNQTIVEITPEFYDLREQIYKPCIAVVRNVGEDIEVEWIGDAGVVQVNGTEYPLKEAHWHIPSEHAVNGKRFDMELHVVHESTDPKLKNQKAVVAVLYRIGEPDPFLSMLTTSILSVKKKHDFRSVGILDPKIGIGTERTSYYRYMGSLTSPPCSEGVIWTINKQVKTVSSDQIRILQEAVDNDCEINARPLQPHNRRDILLYNCEFPICQQLKNERLHVI